MELLLVGLLVCFRTLAFAFVFAHDVGDELPLRGKLQVERLTAFSGFVGTFERNLELVFELSKVFTTCTRGHRQGRMVCVVEACL